MSGYLDDRTLPYLVEKLTDADKIKIEGNVNGKKVGTVVERIIEKSNQITGASFKELKNEGYSFKAGEGSGVDLSDSTLDSFTTFALEGNTYKNLVKNGAEELVLNPEINKEGTGFELDGTAEGGQLGLEIEGQTLKNYMPIKEMKYIQGNNPVIGYINTNNAMTQGKTYTVFFNNINFNVTSLLVKIPEPTTFYSSNFTLKSGILRLKITLDKEIPNDHNINPHFYGDATTEQVKKVRVMILEGDYTQKDVPAFIEGVQGVGRKGKNLLNMDDFSEREGFVKVKDGFDMNYTSTHQSIGLTLTLEEDKKYILSADIDDNKTYIGGNISKGAGYIWVQTSKKSIEIIGKKEPITIQIKNTDNQGVGAIRNIQLEQGDKATTYEPYYEGYKIGVKTHGKNLFSGYNKGIQLKKGNYIFSSKTTDNRRMLIKGANGYELKETDIKSSYFYWNSAVKSFYMNGPSPSLNKHTIIVNENITIKIEVFPGMKEFENIQLEEGTHATSYQPYKESASEIILQDQLQGIGDIKDRLYYDGGYKVEKKINVLEIDTLADKMFNYTPGSNEQVTSMGVELPNFKPESGWSDDNIFCDKLKINENPIVMEEGLCAYSNGYLYITIKNENLKGKSVSEWTKENKPKMWYKAKNPTVIDAQIKTELPAATFNEKTYIAQDSGVKGNLKISNKGYETYNLLPNKEYTVMIDKQGNSPITLDLCGVKKVFDGDKGIISTPTNNVGELKFYGNGKVKNIRLLEGNVTDKTIGYFEGVQGVGESGILKAKTCGKNLFNLKKYNTQSGTELIFSDGIYRVSKTGFEVNANPNVFIKNIDAKTLTLSMDIVEGLGNIAIHVTDMSNKKDIFLTYDYRGQDVMLRDLNPHSELRIRIGKHQSRMSDIAVKNIQLEKGERRTSYEPYEELDFSIDLEEPLMRLPNGACDEITKDGKLIRRVGKIVWNNTTSFSVAAGGWENKKNVITIEGACRDIVTNNAENFSMVSPQLGCGAFSVFWNNAIGIEGLSAHPVGLVACLNTDKIDGDTYEEKRNKQNILNYLEKNPITVYYELKMPVVTDIKPLQARLFKNGHIIFDNKIAPVSTYEVAVNKPAQINAGIKETQKLENRVNALEGLYDSMLLENSHILSNLEFDFSLMKEVDE